MANKIHPTAIIGAGVELGDNNVIGPYTVLIGPTRIGDNNLIGPHASIGTPAEYRGGPHPVGWDGEIEGAGVIIGDGNIIREFVTVNQGTHEPTTIGNDCYALARSHIGHDIVLHNSVTLADAVQLGGHTHVWSWANIGMGTVVHQRTQVGPGAMIGMGSAVRKDVPPFTITVGNPARVSGVNRVGLSRRGCSDAVVDVFASYLAGKSPLPADLPAELADQLAAWSKIQTQES
ncbi:UDP-N-acetylglucosamine acyltransferase [Planosporangium thailandense]|uniref:UDP-N-acetylglucosamine acyltransferase n=1 Tax=Planosporangium thailandense TaxID=765197 RepID=A0ABX0XR99_9ACTN|nr:UDP-N-acetylglucosamine acyltransferase [Planosporangium thailandense]